MQIIDLRAAVRPAGPANWPGWIYPNAVNDIAGILEHVQAYPLNDYRLEGALQVTADSPGGQIVGNGSFGVTYGAGRLLKLVNATTSAPDPVSSYTVVAEIGREYRAVLERRNGTMLIELDGVAVRRLAGATNGDLSGWTSAMNRTTGVPRNWRWTDLTLGRVLANYPESAAVNGNLLFRTSTKIENGGFIRDNPAIPMMLSTNIDLRGYQGDLTLWADARIDPAHVDAAAVCSYGMFGHGAFLGAAAATVFSFAIQQQPSGSWYLICPVSNGTTLFGAANAASQISRAEAVGNHRFALTLDRTANTIAAYIDGALKWSQALPANFGPLNPGNTAGYHLGGRTRYLYLGNASANASDYRIDRGGAILKALSAAEIAAL